MHHWTAIATSKQTYAAVTRASTVEMVFCYILIKDKSPGAEYSASLVSIRGAEYYSVHKGVL